MRRFLLAAATLMLALVSCHDRVGEADPGAKAWAEADWVTAFGRLEALDDAVISSCPPDFCCDQESHSAVVDGVESWWAVTSVRLPWLNYDYLAREAETVERLRHLGQLDPEWAANLARLQGAVTEGQALGPAAGVGAVEASRKRLRALLGRHMTGKDTVPLNDPCEEARDHAREDPIWRVYESHQARPAAAINAAVEGFLDAKRELPPKFRAALVRRDDWRRVLRSRASRAEGAEARGLARALLERKEFFQPDPPAVEDVRDASRSAARSAMGEALLVRRAEALGAYYEEGLQTLPRPEAVTVSVRAVDLDKSTLGEGDPPLNLRTEAARSAAGADSRRRCPCRALAATRVRHRLLGTGGDRPRRCPLRDHRIPGPR